MDKKIEWETVDYHVGGEPVRIIKKGIEKPAGNTMLEKRKAFAENQVIQCTIREPRGHAGMYAAMLTEPVEKGSSFGVLFACNDRCYPMFCGHAFLGAVYYAVQTGVVKTAADGTSRFKVDVPSGTVEAVVTRRSGKIVKAAFINQPCFVIKRDIKLKIPGTGEIMVDLVWSGSFMVYVPAEVLGQPMDYQVISKALQVGSTIEKVLKEQYDFCNPFKETYKLRKIGALVCFVTDQKMESETEIAAKTLNIIDKENYDRGAAGTATCGRLALFNEMGLVREGTVFRNYCLSGQHYTATCLSQQKMSETRVIIPELTADVYEMGESKFILTENDPFPEGCEFL